MTGGGLGDRHQQIVDGVTTNYTLDLAAGLTQVLDDGTNTYLYGNGRISQAGSTTEYFLGDALGSVRQLTDSAGAVTLIQSYAPYGEVTQSVGASQTSYAFTGEATDANGLTYLRARYYDPQDGRFISKDTWAGDYNRPITLNKWQYAYNAPTLYTDPSGQDPWWWEKDFEKQRQYYESMANAPKKTLTTIIATPMKKPPVIAIVGGTTIDTYGNRTGANPQEQLPAYATNPFGYEQLYFQYHDPEYITTQQMLADIPSDCPFICIGYSGGASPCLNVADEMIKREQEVVAIVLLGGTVDSTYNLEENELWWGWDSNGQAPGWDAYAQRISESGTHLLYIDDNSGTGAVAIDMPYYQKPENLLMPARGGLEHNYPLSEDFYGTNSAPLNVNTYLASSIWQFTETGVFIWPLSE